MEEKWYNLMRSQILRVLHDAERTMAEGERAYLDSLYAFHVELTNLENAVGRQLRPEE